ncbi:hypothetical protein JHK84_027888 [Glycine max]|nr:hypothetical protein JHK86_027772 [Glycine max]KAG5151416.1 hypothetical protein JHK84_027888 [Glycine max]
MEPDQHPKIYRMKLWSINKVRAKSKFWYFLRKLKKVKKSNDQVFIINKDFCNKVGNVLRQSVAFSTKALVSSMLNYIRCMFSSKLFIGGLSYGVDDQSLKDVFSDFGDMVDSKFGSLSLLLHGVLFQPPASLTLPYVLQFPLFVDEIFHDLNEEVRATAARGHGLMARVKQLERD